MESATFKQNNNQTIISGMVLPFSDQPNGNGRIYNPDCITTEVLDEFKKEIKEGNALGENFIYGHDLLETTESILLTNVSHIATNIEKTEKGLVGEIRLLATPQGQIIKELLHWKSLCIRPRCTGVVHEDKTVTIDKILSIDILSSYDDAFNPDSYRNRRYRLSCAPNARNKNVRYKLSENKEEA